MHIIRVPLQPRFIDNTNYPATIIININFIPLTDFTSHKKTVVTGYGY